MGKDGAIGSADDVADAGGSVALPAGTVTLLLGDMEGSVRAWEASGADMTGVARRLVELASEAVQRHSGARPVEQGEGDSFVLAFSRAGDAVACALDLQHAIGTEAWPAGVDVAVRMGLHTGDIELRDEGNYAGPTINRCARLRSLGHGGQVLLSQATTDIVEGRLPVGATLRGLGSYRLKGMARSEKVAQLCHPLLTSEFPPLRAGNARAGQPPVPSTSFVGRDAELAALATAMSATRVLSLTGSGGCGKTRLAAKLVTQPVVGRSGEVWWIDLAPVNEARGVAATLAAALDIDAVAGDSAVAAVVVELGDRRGVVVLDNCEHVLDACAELAEAVAGACDSVTIVATSREPLDVSGETVFRVASLRFPIDETSHVDVGHFDAVRLFVDRARMVCPGFDLTEANSAPVAEICRRLDGIPLAIELAAARTKLLAPSQIAAGLSDRFRLLTGGPRTAVPRQRTLEASIDWSYALLSDAEQSVLQAMSVFEGSFDLAAAEAVCGGSTTGGVFDVLAALVDRSLVQVRLAGGDARYWLLETIKVYARQRLVDAGLSDATCARHLAHYLALVESARPRVGSLELLDWLDRLERDGDNVRAAIEWALDSGEADRVLRLAGTDWNLLVVRGGYAEVHAVLARALAASPEGEPGRDRALMTAGVAVMMAGDYRAAVRYLIDAADSSRALGSRAGLANCLAWLGLGRLWSGVGIEHARGELEEAVAIARRLDQPNLLARALSFLGTLVGFTLSYAEARPLHDEAVAVARAANNPVLLAQALFGLGGWLCARTGRLAAARDALDEAESLARDVNDPAVAHISLTARARVELLLGELAVARLTADQALETAEQAGLAAFAAFARFAGAEIELAVGDVTAAARIEGLIAYVEAVGSVANEAAAWWCVAELAFQRGELTKARAGFQRQLRCATTVHSQPEIVRARLGLARVSRAEGDGTAADDLAQEALACAHANDNLVGLIDACELLAGIAAADERPEEAARLFGSAERSRKEICYVRLPVEQPGYERDLEAARSGVGDDFDRLWTEGLALTADEAAAYARRGRGDRKRPTMGWASLTPTELEVVALVAAGCTNPEIADRLFVTRNTVKTHLSHVFTKLGVATRADLAAQAARREDRAP